MIRTARYPTASDGRGRFPSLSWLSMRWGRTAISIGVGLLICFISLGFSSRLLELYSSTMARMENLESGMDTLELQVVEMDAKMNVDSIRQYNIDKITNIFENNKELSTREKYKIADEIYEASRKYEELSVELICATISQESGPGWRTNRISPAGAMGLMQIMPVTGMFMANYEGITWTNSKDILLNPTLNIRIGTRYLAALVDMYGVEGGLAAYNGGEGRARLWLAEGKRDGILYTETQNYVPAVMEFYQEYRQD